MMSGFQPSHSNQKEQLDPQACAISAEETQALRFLHIFSACFFLIFLFHFSLLLYIDLWVNQSRNLSCMKPYIWYCQRNTVPPSPHSTWLHSSLSSEGSLDFLPQPSHRNVMLLLTQALLKSYSSWSNLSNVCHRSLQEQTFLLHLWSQSRRAFRALPPSQPPGILPLQEPGALEALSSCWQKMFHGHHIALFMYICCFEKRLAVPDQSRVSISSLLQFLSPPCLNLRLFLNPRNWQQSKYMNINLMSLGLNILQSCTGLALAHR